jgi:hypothetical protein
VVENPVNLISISSAVNPTTPGQDDDVKLTHSPLNISVTEVGELIGE